MRVKPQPPAHRDLDCPRPAATRQGRPVGALRAVLTSHPAEARSYANSLRRFAMCSITTCLALMVPLSGGFAASNTPVRFQMKEYQNPQPTDPYLKNVWPGLTEKLTREVRAVVANFPPPGHYAPSKFWIATFSIDNKKVLLSIVDHPQAGCQGSGIHHDTLPHELSCPTRLTIIEGNKYITSDAGLTCFYRDNTFATYDEKARSLHIFSTVDGKPASDCENNIHFPEGATQ